MTEDNQITPNPLEPRTEKPRRFTALRNFGWISIGILIALVVVADPLRISPFHDWLYRLHREDPATGRTIHANAVTSPNSPSPEAGQRRILFYRNPMNPTITSPTPMKDEMGMDYAPVYADQASATAAPGTVRVDPAMVQDMNVQIEPVSRRDISHQVRTVGTLDYDQQRVVTVTTKYSGFIEKVNVNYIGDTVHRGQRLFAIYSPELVQTQQELLSALSFARRMKNAPDDARRQAGALVDSARTRLGYWDISPAQVRELESSGKVTRTLTVTSPASGIVTQRQPALEGMAVRPGMELFRIADLSSVWVSVQAYENQLPWLRPGSEATIRLDAFPGETFRGKVRFVEPQVTEKTRTLNLRIEVPNRSDKLRPGMYATVLFEPVAAKNVIAVPSTAVLRTGQRNIVIVADGNGRFTPHEVQLGAEGDSYVQVLSGLDAGAMVVTSSQFLIDSESNLQEAIQKMATKKPSGGAHAE